MNTIYESVRNIIVEASKNSDIKDTDLLQEHGIDSVLLIKIVVAIEDELEFEFEPSKLNYETLRTIDSICKYIETVKNKDNK